VVIDPDDRSMQQRLVDGIFAYLVGFIVVLSPDRRRLYGSETGSRGLTGGSV
jgi:hypothetical protein